MRGAEALDEVPTSCRRFLLGVCSVRTRREIAHWEWGSGGSPADAKPWQARGCYRGKRQADFQATDSHGQHCGDSRHQTESVVTMWRHVLAIYLLIALATEAVVIRLNIFLMRSSVGRHGRWDAADVAGTIVLAMLWPVSLLLLLT